MQINVNNRAFDVPTEWRDDSLLQVLREAMGLVGAKFGCGAGLCGACTVLLGGEPIRSCLTPVSAAEGKPVQTIEGLAPQGSPASLAQSRFATVRILPVGPNHGRRCAFQKHATSNRQSN